MKERENYLLFVPSLLTERAEMFTYTAGDQAQEYEGMQTNEAVSKYLADYLHEQGTSLTKIIMLCSQEVCQDKINKADRRTTLQYYKDAVWSFLEKYREDYKDKEELFETIPLKSEKEQTAEDIVEPIKQILEITEGKQTDGGKHLYVDFTGGMRNTALMLVFSCRILQRLGVEVDKILYSNISSRTVEECTKTYDYFELFEYLVKREYNPDNFDRYDSMIKKCPKQEQEKIKEVVNNFKLICEQKELNQYDKIPDTSKKIIEEMESIEYASDSSEMKQMRELLYADCKNARAFSENEEDPELPLLEEYIRNNQHDKAFNLYREKIIKILYKEKIINVNKQFLRNGEELIENRVTQEILGVYCYYENPDQKADTDKKNNKTRKTFMDAVKFFIDQAGKASDQPPKEVYEKTMGDAFYDMAEYLSKVPKWGFNYNDFTRKECDKKVLSYLSKEYGKQEMKTFIDNYNKLGCIYMCYGFPFAATYSSWYLKGYDQMYRNTLKRGVECLQDFYEGNDNTVISGMLACFPDKEFTYQTLIQALSEDPYKEMLHILFPYRLEKWRIYSDILKGREWDEFIYKFVKSFYFIKKVRNYKIHKKDLKSKDIQNAVREIEENLNLIRKYTCR